MFKIVNYKVSNFNALPKNHLYKLSNLQRMEIRELTDNMHVVIIGNGISGTTAARHIRKKSNCRISLISGESDYFFSRTALMYIYMGHLTFDHTKPYEDSFWSENRLECIRAIVKNVEPTTKKLVFEDGRELGYDILIIASGSKPQMFGWEGQHLQGVQGLYALQDLELLERQAPNARVCPRAVLVGGGLIGIELAEMLRSRDIEVTFLVRENGFWNNVLPNRDSELINKHIRDHHIDLRLNTGLSKILGNSDGKVQGVITDTGDEIPCSLVGITTGVTPNIDFLKDSGLEMDKGVLVNDLLETSIPEIYAIGDCAELRKPEAGRRAIEAVWYTGRLMGETVAETISGNPTPYSPGNWFNSAKFLDIEYQTYGRVSPDHLRDPKEMHFHWQHAKLPIGLTFAFETDSRKFLGLNAFGVRIRHLILDQWITLKLPIEAVINRFNEALFDPEFSRKHIGDVQGAFIEFKNKSR
jgi:NADPH-dependent 2,4-dienoyl-CoA reductase/sulfur reductase-like enzyme